jgi:hypothetical protein
MLARSWLLLAVVVMASCTPQFAPASVVSSPRLIAVIANPPESVVGGEVQLTPVVASPGGTLQPSAGLDDDGNGQFSASWWRCPDEDSDALGDFFVCQRPASRRDLGVGSPFTDQIPDDVFGPLPAIEPNDPPTPLPSGTPPPEKYLGALLGYYRIVGVDIRIGGERVVDGFKRIPTYLPVPLSSIDERLAALDTRLGADGLVVQNTNPSLLAVTIREGSATGPSIENVEVGGNYFLVPIYDERSLQPYKSLSIDLQGLDTQNPETLAELTPEALEQRVEVVQRCEIPVFSWFITSGRVRRETTQDESVITNVFDPQGIACPTIEGEIRTADTAYTPPDGSEEQPLPADGVVHGWVVLRDGRGGVAVRDFLFTVTP